MPEPNGLPLVVAALLLVTAGCSSLPGPAEPTTTPTATTTASTDSPTQNATELAPGLTESGVSDAWALAQAHRTALANVTYTERTSRSVRANGTLLRTVTTTLQRGHGDRYRYVFHSFGVDAPPLPNLTVVRTNSTLVHRTKFKNGTTAYAGPEHAATPQTDNFGNVYTVLTASNTTIVETVTRNATTRYRLRSVGQPTAGSAYAGTTNYTLSALVTPDALITTYSVSYETRREGQPVTVSSEYHVTDRGQTTVREPGWVSNVTATDGGTPHSQRA